MNVSHRDTQHSASSTDNLPIYSSGLNMKPSFAAATYQRQFDESASADAAGSSGGGNNQAEIAAEDSDSPSGKS